MDGEDITPMYNVEIKNNVSVTIQNMVMLSKNICSYTVDNIILLSMAISRDL